MYDNGLFDKFQGHWPITVPTFGLQVLASDKN